LANQLLLLTGPFAICKTVVYKHSRNYSIRDYLIAVPRVTEEKRHNIYKIILQSFMWMYNKISLFSIWLFLFQIQWLWDHRVILY